jgi:GT2 family glycosyltransferase/glycosyltransferase involved in cell wall biosynthesis
LRILIVHHGYPPEAVGGSEIYTAALARQLARTHQVTVLHRSTDPERLDHDLRASRDGNLTLVSLNNLHRDVAGFESYGDARAAAAVMQIVDAANPEVVHIGHLSGLSTRIVFEARRRGAAVVFTLHDFATLCALGQLLDLRGRVCPGPTPWRCLRCVGAQVAVPPSAPVVSRFPRRPPPALVSAAARALARATGAGRGRIARRLEEMREVLRSADVLVSPSAFLRDRMAALGVPGIQVLENGHEAVEILPRVPDPQGRVRFGFLGACLPSKGVHVLAQAFARLHDPRALLEIHGPFPPYHGDTTYEARVRAILGPAAAEMLRGAFTPDRLPGILARLDVIVVPSIWEENAPLVVQEAFLARRPVLVSDHGGLAERVREGIDGLRFRPGDAADLARAMKRLLDDPLLRARLGTTPPPVPSLSEHVGALEGLYDEACRRHRARPGRVGVVVLYSGRAAETARAVESSVDPHLDPRIVVVANGPGETLALPEGVDLLRLPENRGYAGGMNAGIAHLRAAGCDRVLLLSSDAVLEPGCLRRLAEAFSEPGLAAVGPVVLRDADGRVESAGASFDPWFGRYRLLAHGAEREPREGLRTVSTLSGAAWMLSTAALDRVGPLEESYFLSFEDTDWCVRARRAGFRLGVVLGAEARHAEGRSLGPERLYYAARNHLAAAGRLRPLPALVGWVRTAVIVALNLTHAVRQRQVRRVEAVRAVLAGCVDFHRGRRGPRVLDS